MKTKIYLPTDEAKTKPRPTAKGPPIFKNFSEGAVTAMADKPIF